MPKTKSISIGDDVRDVLDNAMCEGNNLTLTGQLSRDLYVKTNKVLKALGGKWNRKAKAHIFAEPAGALIAKALSDGGVADEKWNRQAFYTPPELAKYLVRLAGVEDGEPVLEPSAGGGSIARAIMDAGAFPTCVEIDPKCCEALDKMFRVIQRDFLSYTISGWDRIVMNPPFTGGQDIQHVSHALDLLSDDGTLVAVMPAGVKTCQYKKYVAFRERVDNMRGRFIDLPEGAFKASGTMVRTVALVVGG
jgi:predicted RNA methylase